MCEVVQGISMLRWFHRYFVFRGTSFGGEKFGLGFGDGQACVVAIVLFVGAEVSDAPDDLLEVVDARESSIAYAQSRSDWLLGPCRFRRNGAAGVVDLAEDNEKFWRLGGSG